MDVLDLKLLQWQATSSKFPSTGTSPRTQYSLHSPAGGTSGTGLGAVLHWEAALGSLLSCLQQTPFQDQEGKVEPEALGPFHCREHKSFQT